MGVNNHGNPGDVERVHVYACALSGAAGRGGCDGSGGEWAASGCGETAFAIFESAMRFGFRILVAL